MAKIFLSSEAEYREFTHELLIALEYESISVWSGFNPELERIDGYWPLVDNQISLATGILAVVSSPGSDHVLFECQKASRDAELFVVYPTGKKEERIHSESILNNALSFNFTGWCRDQANTEFDSLVKELRRHIEYNNPLRTRRSHLAANSASVSVNSAALADQVDAEISRVQHSMPNDLTALEETKRYIHHLTAISSKLKDVSDRVAEIKDGDDILPAKEEIRSLHDLVVKFGRWIFGRQHGENAVAITYYGVFAAFLMSCGVNPLVASTVPGAAFLGGKLAERIKGLGTLIQRGG